MLGALDAGIDTDSAQLRWTLHTSAYTPNRQTHDFVNDLTGELATANGYTQGGITVVGSRALTVADSWGTSRANSTAYTVGAVVRPASANGFLYRAVTSGTSGGSVPAFPTVVGQTVADGSVTWECAGSAIVVLDTTDPVWPAASFTGVRHAVLSDRTAGTAATQRLLGYIDFTTDRAGQGGSFTVQLNSQGVFHWFIP
jgi:hypothetical protein